MSNKEIFNMLEDMRLRDIKVLMNISMEYLINVYGVDYKKLLKELKNCHKELERHKKRSK